MKNLWAPWRSEYILSNDKSKECIFCHALQDDNDEENLLVYRGESCFCVLNKYPYSGGHLMVSPNRHIIDILDLTRDEMAELMTLTGKVQLVLKNEMHPDGFNIGANIGKAAGAGVEGHFHMHVVPRWIGDTNFMPIMSDTKVISQSLSDVYSLIRSKLK
ncbi:MAG: HIT family protein [Candidatus Anammoxibacter sp.]